VLFEYCSGRPARTRALYDAYLDAGGPGRITRPEDFSMAIAQLAHILEGQCANWLTATAAEERRRAEAAIDEFVSRPHTRPVIDEILAAVARQCALRPRSPLLPTVSRYGAVTADAAAIEQAAVEALARFTLRRPVRLLGVRAEFAR
jgi:hypothetical protein